MLIMGITGHRLNRLDPLSSALVASRLGEVMAAVAIAASQLQAIGPDWFQTSSPDIRLVSALAEGADRLAAAAALDAGFRLDVATPFERSVYEGDFPTDESRTQFQALLASAGTILELPGTRAQEETAYTLAGAAILAVADMLIAVWNGQGSGGRGGTGDTVATALAQGKPVIHIPIVPEQPIRILWPGDGPAGGSWHSAIEPPSRPFDLEGLEQVLAGRLLPPADPAEQRALATFLDEEEKLIVHRIEYPLLLWATGVDKFPKNGWKKEPYRQSTRQWWTPFDAAIGDHIEPRPRDMLEGAYAFADNLASRFAQYFRSGHVINFAFSALAVALALSGLLLPPAFKIGLVGVELLLIGMIVLNTRIGHREAWHQRWLDYRQLAERLRPMRSLKLLGIAQPPNVSAASRTGSLRWIDWYATAIWRQLGLPSGRIDQARIAELLALLQDQEIGPEIRYHQKNAHRMQHVNHRLHQFGSLCFLTTVLLCVGFLFYAALMEKSHTTAIIFSVLTAALPAFGSAAYGLRVQGDFAGSAARSAETAKALAEVRIQLDGCTSLTRAAALGNAAAAVMLVDLAEWRLTYEQRRLEIPG